MEGYDEGFLSFLKFILIVAVISVIWGKMSDDMARRGVFGKEEQQKALRANLPSRPL
jgi:hypothetical protein